MDGWSDWCNTHHVHGQCWHADIYFVAGGTLFGQLRIRTAMSLFVSRQVRRGGVMFSALGTCVTLALFRLIAAYTGTIHRTFSRTPVTNEEGVIGVADGHIFSLSTLLYQGNIVTRVRLWWKRVVIVLWRVVAGWVFSKRSNTSVIIAPGMVIGYVWFVLWFVQIIFFPAKI